KQHFKHLSRFSMGSDIADINNDGYQDLMTLDMMPNDESVEKSSVGEDPLDIYLYKLQFGYFNQYSRNCLQLNMGGRKFSDIAPMAGVMATDWSWSTLMADYDNDGIKDIFVTNGILKRPNDLDYLKFVVSDSLHYGLPTSQKLDQEAIDIMPDGKWNNFLFKGTKELIFQDKSKDWGFGEKGISNGAAYADIDNDGDLDLITNNINEEVGLYLNKSNENKKTNYVKIRLKGLGKNTFGIGAKVILKSGKTEQIQQLMPTRGFMSSVEPVLNFGLDTLTQIDSMVVIWESQKSQTFTKIKANQTVVIEEKNAINADINFHFTPSEKPLFENVTTKLTIPFVHKENIYFDFNREFLIPFKLSIEGPKIAVGDVNSDGLDDFYVGGAKYQAGELYLQNKAGFQKSIQTAFAQDTIFEDVDAVFFDADGDKDQDLYVVSGGNEFYGKMDQQFDRLYLNDGKGKFTRTFTALPPMFSNKSTALPCDFDKDGDLDLFVAGRVVPYSYGEIPDSYILVNDGKGKFTDETDKIAKGLRKAGMLTDAIWTDFDKDGDQDLTVVGEWMPVKFFENNKGIFTEIESGIDSFTGFYKGIVANDFDKDGDIDFAVGNLGTNTKLRKEEGGTLKMWIKDFDKNNTKEHILAYNRASNYYPIASKDELGKQMPSIINKRFTNYKEFAGKMIEEILEAAELKDSDEKVINTFHSIYIENLGNGKFTIKNLPSLSQVSKVMAMYVEDINADGNADILLGGNYDGASMYQARYDASFGLILKGDGKGGFSPALPTDHGFLLEGDVRDIKPILIDKAKHYLISRNNDKIMVMRKL
ncbi:MAG: FG-GAP-like repeat-containing protein, partial [Bacteroidota bacterium]